MSDTIHTGDSGSHGSNGTPEHAVRFERDDIQTGPVVWFVVGLIILTALVFVGMLVMMNAFNESESESKKSPWEVSDAEKIKEQEVRMAEGPIAGDAGRNRFRGVPRTDVDQRNRSSIGNTPRLEGIDLYNPDDPINHLPEHTNGRHLPAGVASAGMEQRLREDAYLESWSAYGKGGVPRHVPIEVAMKHLAKGRSAPLPRDEWEIAPGRSSSGRVSRIPDADEAKTARQGHDPSAKDPPVEGPKK